jgi:hypothetical protein
MEIKITTKQILKVLQILSWIIFIGLCIEAGGVIFNTFYTFVINPINAEKFWGGANLSKLYHFDRGHFLAIATTVAIVAVLKAIMFYLIIKLFVNKRLNISHPFSPELKDFILNASYLALGIGLFSYSGNNYAAWLSKQGVEMPGPHLLQTGGADVWLFMAVILFIIAQLVKRGIEIQTENDLTI